jgi:fermentation-respiration switch protein FrsA (DUF1100 family)
MSNWTTATRCRSTTRFAPRSAGPSPTARSGRASGSRRPLLLIHGLADTNVFPAHTLRLSSALLAAGRPHEVLLLPGVGHQAMGDPVTEQLLWHQVRFLQRHLRVDPETGPA